MTSVLAIDPGSAQSAWLRYEGDRPQGFGITANDVLVRALRTGGLPEVVVIEKVESYGMAVGADVFDTVLWAGRFAEAAHRVPVVLLPRRAVKLALAANVSVTPLIAFVYFFPRFSPTLVLVAFPWAITAPAAMLLVARWFGAPSGSRSRAAIDAGSRRVAPRTHVHENRAGFT